MYVFSQGRVFYGSYYEQELFLFARAEMQVYVFFFVYKKLMIVLILDIGHSISGYISARD